MYHYAPDLCGKHYNHRFVQIDGTKVPTVTKFVDEMCKEGYVNDCGKLETSGGRHPSLYGLNADSAYFIRGSDGGTVVKPGGNQL